MLLALKAPPPSWIAFAVSKEFKAQPWNRIGVRESLLNFFVLFFSHAAPVIIFIIIPGSFASVCGPAQQSILRLFYSPAGPKVYPKSTSPNIPSLSFLPLFPALPHSLAPARSGCLTTLGDGDQAITVTREITNLTSDQICWQSERPRVL